MLGKYSEEASKRPLQPFGTKPEIASTFISTQILLHAVALAGIDPKVPQRPFEAFGSFFPILPQLCIFFVASQQAFRLAKLK